MRLSSASLKAFGRILTQAAPWPGDSSGTRCPAATECSDFNYIISLADRRRVGFNAQRPGAVTPGRHFPRHANQERAVSDFSFSRFERCFFLATQQTRRDP